MTRTSLPEPRLFLLGVLALAGCGRADAQSADSRGADSARTNPAVTTTVAARASANEAVNTSRRTALVQATSRVAPSVVSISVTARQRVTQGPWDEFFVPQGAERIVQGAGTGFVIRPNGIIVTNQHVVAGAQRILVTLPDGSEAEGRVLGEDPTTDIAVVKIDRSGLAVAPLGRSADLMIGEWVLALGNPYAYLLGNSEPSVTAGVVSAVGRNILPSRNQVGLYLDMIQTDAAINPGNSGGPLTNALGEVVGVNSSILSSSGGSIGLGFAIPIERAVRVADEIIRNGSVRRAWIGLEVAGAESMRDWKSAGGVVVSSVAPRSPAARAGLNARDVLVSADGRPLRNYLDWEAVKLDLHVGDSVDVMVRGAGGAGTTRRRLVTGDLPTVSAEKVTVLRDLQLVTVTPEIRAERSLRSDRGALLYRVTPSVARATGLQSGDVIVAVNRTPVLSATEVADFLGALRPRQAVRLYFERDGRYSYTDLVFQ